MTLHTQVNPTKGKIVLLPENSRQNNYLPATYINVFHIIWPIIKFRGKNGCYRDDRWIKLFPICVEVNVYNFKIDSQPRYI